VKLLIILLNLYIAINSQTFRQKELIVTVNPDSVINTCSDYFFGHNYWLWCESWGNKIAGTEKAVSDLNVKILRFGGIAVDVGFPDFVSNGILSEFYNYSKKIGAEPFLQLQVAKFAKSEPMVENALNMVGYFKKIHPLTYVSIGNEPDIYVSTLASNDEYKVEHLSEYKLEDYCNSFNAVSGRLRAEYPELKITGLELSWNYDNWIPGFVANCKDNFDMISTHYYPFPPGQCTYDKVSIQYSEISDFYKRIRELIDRNAEGKNIPLVIGETNITYDGEPKKCNLNASPGTFAAALWFADFLGISSTQKNLFSVMPWSIKEDWMLGFLSPQKRPVYFTYQMFSDFMKKYCIHMSNHDDRVRIYGYRDDRNYMSFFAVNWDTLSAYKTIFRHADSTKGDSFNCILPPYSLTCITMEPDMKNTRQYIFTQKLAAKGYIGDTDKKFRKQFIPKKQKFLKFRAL